MTKIAIFVATTGGPAQVERLTPEFAPHSMVCLRRGSDILPISDDYDDFVKRGSGVIEREFGPFDTASFRMDVSTGIGAGKSWQLGVFAAHAVAASDSATLADSEEAPDVVVWLTGEVDYDLGVGEVGHVAEKIEASWHLFEKWQKAGVAVLALVPAGQNFEHLDNAALPPGIEVVAVSNAAEILARLNLGEAKAPSDAARPVRPKRRKKTGQFAALLAVVVLLALAGWAMGPDRLAGIMQNFKSPPVQKTALPGTVKQDLPAPPKLAAKPLPALHVFEQRPPEDASCAKVHFGRVEAISHAIKAVDEGAVSSKKNLCGLKFIFDLGPKSKFIAANLDIETGAFVRGNTRPAILSGITKAKGAQTWSINVPRRLAEPLQYRLIVIIGKTPAAAELLWFKNQSDGKQAAQTLEVKGFQVLTWRHKITP